jgi:hypothetical protein
VLLLALLAGCAVNGDLRLERSGAGLMPGAAVALTPPPEGNPEAARFAAALTQALTAQGYRISETAPITATFGLAHRDRAIGAANGSAGAGPARWVSAPGRRRFLQACKGERLRAMIAFYGREAQGVISRASGEIDGCRLAPENIDALAAALVREAAAR